MVIARHNHIKGVARDQGAVVGHVGLDNADHQLGAISPRLLGRGNAGVDSRLEGKAIGAGNFGGRVLSDRNKRDLDAAHFHMHHAAKARNRRAVFVGDVDRGPRIVRRRHFLEEVGGTGVKLVVAGHGKIKGHKVGQIDSVLAAVKARQQRRREHITVHHIDRVRVCRPLGLGNGIDRREALVKLVDVTNAENGDRYGIGSSRQGNSCT